MTIRAYIQTVATALGLKFIDGTKAWQNLLAEDEPGPFLFLDQPITSNDTLHQSGFIEPVYTLNMLFLKINQMDETPEQLEVTVQEMRTKARNAIITFQNDDENIRTVTGASRLNVYNAMDENLSGCLLTITLTPRNNTSICI